MNFSWLPLLGGGLATAITLAVGADLTGLSNAFAPVPSPEPTTVYVEQPVVEVQPPAVDGERAAELPALVIAVLPAMQPVFSAVTSTGSSDQNDPSYEVPASAPQPPATTPQPPQEWWGDDDEDGDNEEGDEMGGGGGYEEDDSEWED